MGELRVTISDVLHRELKRKALDRGITLKKLVIDTLEREIRGENI